MDMSYSEGRDVKRSKIAMPPLEEIEAVTQSLGNHSAPSIQKEEVAFNNVPDELPEETSEMMQRQDSIEEESIDQEVEVAPVQAAQKTKSDNFAELRKAREAAERKAERIERENEILREQMYSRKVAPAKEEIEDFDFSLADDDLSTGKDMRQVYAKTKVLEKRIKDMQEESRIRARYPDLDSVVTDENIYLLRQQEPEIAASLNLAPDSWDKLAAVYTMIKKTGIHKTHAYDSDKIKAVTNAHKPKPLAAIQPQTADTPLSKANAFAQDYKMSKESAANTWREMQAAMKKG